MNRLVPVSNRPKSFANRPNFQPPTPETNTMPRPLAGDPPATLPPAPYQTPPNGLPATAAVPSPFNYTNQPSMPAPVVQSTPTASGLLNAFRRRWVLGTLSARSLPLPWASVRGL